MGKEPASSDIGLLAPTAQCRRDPLMHKVLSSEGQVLSLPEVIESQ
jgi:hypothetical protein